MTHNTREVEEVVEKLMQSFDNLTLSFCHDENGNEIQGTMYFKDMWSFTYRLIQKGIATTIHHQLQKARHDWLREEIVKLEGMKVARYKWDYKEGDGEYKEAFNQALQTIIDRYHSELDQKVSK